METAELYPGHAAELARRERRTAALQAAAADPLPGPMAESFAQDPPQEIAGLRVRPVVHYDFVLLKRLESPLLRQFTAEAGQRTEFDDEQGYEMILQFTRPAKEAAALVAKGREAFREAALEEIGYRLGPVEVALLVKAVEREFVRAFATVVKYGAPSPAGDGTVFTPPPVGPTMTGSAGGSDTSAV